MKRLYDTSLNKLSNAPAGFYRALYYKISDESQLTGIIGPRGVGKTSLLMQLARDKYSDSAVKLYVSLDDPRFSIGGLVEVVDEFAKMGGELLILDEVDKYQKIVTDLNLLLAANSHLKILFACSSAGNDDGVIYELSRIAELYYLPGLSFREYLEFRHNLAFPVIPFHELIEYNRMPGSAVLNRIRPLKYFEEYLKQGYFPIKEDDENRYLRSVGSIVRANVAEDIMAAYRIDYESVVKMFRVLTFIANEGPFKPNIEKLADYAGTTRDSLLKFLKYMHKAGLIAWLTSGHGDINYLNKPARLYLGCTDLHFALSDEDLVRQKTIETFTFNQLRNQHQVNLVKEGQFLIDLEYHFEMEWKMGKSAQMVQNNSFIIVDGIENQVGNKIPLWMLGFLY